MRRSNGSKPRDRGATREQQNNLVQAGAMLSRSKQMMLTNDERIRSNKLYFFKSKKYVLRRIKGRSTYKDNTYYGFVFSHCEWIFQKFRLNIKQVFAVAYVPCSRKIVLYGHLFSSLPGQWCQGPSSLPRSSRELPRGDTRVPQCVNSQRNFSAEHHYRETNSQNWAFYC